MVGAAIQQNDGMDECLQEIVKELQETKPGLAAFISDNMDEFHELLHDPTSFDSWCFFNNAKTGLPVYSVETHNDKLDYLGREYMEMLKISKWKNNYSISN